MTFTDELELHTIKMALRGQNKYVTHRRWITKLDYETNRLELMDKGWYIAKVDENRGDTLNVLVLKNDIS